MSEAPPIITPSVESSPEPGRPWNLWQTLVFSLALAFVYFIAQSVLGGVLFAIYAALGHPLRAAAEIEHNGLFLSVMTWSALPVIVGGCILLAYLRRGISVRDYLGFHRVPRTTLLKCVAIFLVFLFVTEMVSTFFDDSVTVGFMLDVYRTAGFKPLLWPTLMVAAPVGEEIFFRGFLFQGLRYSRLGGIGAVFITAATWSIIHFQYDAYGVIMIFATGIFLGTIRLRVDSILPTMLLHALMNGIATYQMILMANSLGE